MLLNPVYLFSLVLFIVFSFVFMFVCAWFVSIVFFLILVVVVRPFSLRSVCSFFVVCPACAASAPVVISFR